MYLLYPLTATKNVTKLIQRHIGSIYGAFVPLYFTKVMRVINLANHSIKSSIEDNSPSPLP